MKLNDLLKKSNLYLNFDIYNIKDIKHLVNNVNILLSRQQLDIKNIDTEDKINILDDKTIDILPNKETLYNLIHNNQNNIKVKLGIDPTSPNIHIGHTIAFRLLNIMRNMGLTINIIIGDFTTKIGDPSGRVSERPILSEKDINNNLSTYKEQINKYISGNNIEVFYNSQWLSKLTYEQLINITRNIPISQLLQREDFRKRITEKNLSLTLSEVLYPIAMAYDSCYLNSDIEIGGQDQLLNMQMGRLLMKSINKTKQQIIMTTPLLMGTHDNNQKMSKSNDNYISITSNSTDIYGQIMSISDQLLIQYINRLLFITKEEFNKIANIINNKIINPMYFKHLLAIFLISEIYNNDIAINEYNRFNTQFSNKKYNNLDNTYPTIKFDNDQNIANILTKLNICKSNNEIKRIAKQNGIKLIINDKSTLINEKDIYETLNIIIPQDNTNDIVLKVGKRLCIIKY